MTALDVRVTLQTKDGALIYMRYQGYLIPPSIPSSMPGAPGQQGEQNPQEEYFVVTPYFETSAPQYAWLQQVVTVGVGIDVPGGVGYHIFAVR